MILLYHPAIGAFLLILFGLLILVKLLSFIIFSIFPNCSKLFKTVIKIVFFVITVILITRILGVILLI